MNSLTQYSAAQALEHYLGDPMDPEKEFSFKRAIELDEQEAYPTEICQLLSQWNFDRYYIPETHGGRINSFEEILAMGRAIARRDLTVTIAHGVTYLGAAPIWVGGNYLQKEKLANRIAKGQKIAFGLTEKAHGSDILANETRADKVEGGYLLSGEKWLVGNATRSDAIALFARTRPKGGPRGFSWFLVEKEYLDSSSYSHLPKIKTHGLRGADISGIRFNQSFVPEDALIGTEGAGLELALKALQITRAIHVGAASSLGQVDTALRVTLAFVLSRQLYGESLWKLPNVRQKLIDVFLDILICDCLSIAVARSVHTVPEQMSLYSSVVKYFVPTTVETLIDSLASVLGARYYLREEHCWGIFQKIVRDHAIVSVFDGSAAVNLNSIVLQLYQLAEHRTACKDNNREIDRDIPLITFTLDSPLPPFEPQRLELYNRGQDQILQGVEVVLEQLTDLKPSADIEATVLQQIVALTYQLIQQINLQDKQILDLGMQNIARASKSAELFVYAKRYCAFQAALACIQIWLYNRRSLSNFFGRGEWLVCVLQRLLKSLNVKSVLSNPVSYHENMATELLKLYHNKQTISICSFPLA